MLVRGVLIEDTFAEAFTMRVARLVITGGTPRWAREAGLKLTGFATSVIGCKCEAGIERELSETETPDGRPGVSVLFLTMDKESLPQQLISRIGQTVLTCPTIRARTEAQLPEGVNSVLEIVLDGTDAPAIAAAMRLGIDAACRPGVQAITAGNYGGKLGPHHFHLRRIMGGESQAA